MLPLLLWRIHWRSVRIIEGSLTFWSRMRRVMTSSSGTRGNVGLTVDLW